MVTKFTIILGDPSDPSDKFSNISLYHSWKEYIDQTTDKIPKVIDPPDMMLEVHSRLLNIAQEINISRDKAKFYLEIIKYKYVIDDLWRYYKIRNWEPLFPGDFWSHFDYEKVKDIQNCFFDRNHEHRLTSNSTIFVFYFGHGEYSTGEWVITNPINKVPWKFVDLLEKFIYVIQKEKLTNLNLIIVSDSCSSGNLIEIFEQYFKDKSNQDLLKQSNVTISLQVSSGKYELSYVKYFSLLFLLLQDPKLYDTYITFNTLVVEKEIEFDLNDDIFKFRPIQIPDYRCYGNPEMLSELRKKLNLFNIDDGNAMRLFWEYYGKTFLDLNENDFINTFPKVKHMSKDPDSVPSNNNYPLLEQLVDSSDSTQYNSFLYELLQNQIEDITTYTAGRDMKGFIIVVKVDQIRYSIHLHCKPKLLPVTNNVYFEPETNATHNISKLFTPYFEKFFERSKSLAAFRIRASSRTDAETLLNNHVLSFHQNFTIIKIIEIQSGYLYLFVVQNYESEFLTLDNPVRDITPNIKVFLIPKHQYYQEVRSIKRPLISIGNTSQNIVWLNHMCEKVRLFLVSHSSITIFYTNKNGSDISKNKTLADWMDEIGIAYSRVPGEPKTFIQWDWNGSLMGSFNIR